MSERFLEQVAEGLVVRPGDTLIVRLAPDVGKDEAQRFRVGLREMLADRAPGVELIVLAGHIEQMAVARSGGADG